MFKFFGQFFAKVVILSSKHNEKPEAIASGFFVGSLCPT